MPDTIARGVDVAQFEVRACEHRRNLDGKRLGGLGINDPRFATALARSFIYSIMSSPNAFAERVRFDSQEWDKVIRDARWSRAARKLCGGAAKLPAHSISLPRYSN